MKLFPRVRPGALVPGLLAASVLLPGCSVYMQSQRPDPVGLSQFTPGMTRMQVVSRLGTPAATVIQNGQPCDVFRIYVGQHGAAGKAAVMVLEGAAAVFTLGLSEILLAPAEAVTKSELTPVAFCYEDGARLASIAVIPKPGGAARSPEPQPDMASASPAVTAPAPPRP